MLSIKQEEEQEEEEDPMTIFMYALKAPDTRRQYPQRFKMFLDYLKLEGPLEKQARQFLSKAKNDPQWDEENFMQLQAFKLRGSNEERYLNQLFQIIIKQPSYSVK